MKALIISVIFALSFAAAFAAESLNREGIELSVTVHFFDSKSELHKALNKKGHKGLKYSNDGIALVYVNSNKCEIYTLRSKRLNDNPTMVLGHEMLHCIYGEYHSNDAKR